MYGIYAITASTDIWLDGKQTDEDYIHIMSVNTEEDAKTAINLDILIIDALRDKPHLSHESTGEALLQIARIAPKKAYLIHMSHGFGLHAAMEHKLPENVHIAYDRLKITI